MEWGEQKSQMETNNVRKIKQNTKDWRFRLMKKQIYDEKNGMSYTLHGDYYLPDLVE